MGQYGGGRGQKWSEIGNVVYGWPLICHSFGSLLSYFCSIGNLKGLQSCLKDNLISARYQEFLLEVENSVTQIISVQLDPGRLA